MRNGFFIIQAVSLPGNPCNYQLVNINKRNSQPCSLEMNEQDPSKPFAQICTKSGNSLCERAEMFEERIYDRTKAIFQYFRLPFDDDSNRLISVWRETRNEGMGTEFWRNGNA